MIDFEQLTRNMKGDVMTDSLHQMIYATDASAYREMPIAVVYPRDASDVKECIKFARKNGITLIPRAAGTSLAGQVVGKGVVVDVSRYMNHVLEINEKEHWVRVEPGVVLDELNMRVKSLGLFFGPETSTSNRCCLGGMVGNNSCGSHSLVYGSTRDHLLEAKVILSDGEEAWLKGMEKDEVRDKMTEDTLEGKIYRCSVEMLENNREEIIQHFPDPALRRRNSGYAIDQLLYSDYFDVAYEGKFNLCKLLAGSEGTLAFVTELKLNLVPLPPKEKAVICVHCRTLEEAFEGNLVALKHHPVAIELMDQNILELSKGNIAQNKNRFFVQGDPAAILIVEFARDYHNEGKSIYEAALEGGRVRLRPILMTSFAFILGTFPLVISTGAGAASRISLGIAVFAGMLMSSLVGTLFMPNFYYMMQSLQERLGRKKHNLPAKQKCCMPK